MKLLFLTPPMRNWVRWGQKHIACNPLHAHLAAFVRERNAADVDVLDCRALELNQEEMLERIRALGPDAVFLGTRLVTDGGASPVVFNLEAMNALKEAFPRLITILGGLGVSAIPKEIIGLAPQLDYLLIGEDGMDAGGTAGGIKEGCALAPGDSGIGVPRQRRSSAHAPAPADAKPLRSAHAGLRSLSDEPVHRLFADRTL